MIHLTPLDVRNKRGDFKKLMRGYDPHEVDIFLELVAERLEALVRENLQLRERATRLQHEVTAHSEREQAVQDALVTAQELRADIRTQSEREAGHVLKEAESEARRLIAEAEAEARGVVGEAEAASRGRLRDIERQLDEAHDALQELERRRSRFLKEFRTLLDREMDVVQVEEGRTPFQERAIDMELGAPRSERLADAAEVSGMAESASGAEGTSTAEDAPSANPAAAPTDFAHPPADHTSADADTGPAPDEPGTATAEAVPPDEPASVPLDAAASPVEHLPARGRAEPVSPEPDTEAADGTPSAGSDTVQGVAGLRPEEAKRVAPPADVGDHPSALELELTAGASSEGQPEPGQFPGVPNLEDLLAEAAGDGPEPPSPEEIAPPPAPRRASDQILTFDPEREEKSS